MVRGPIFRRFHGGIRGPSMDTYKNRDSELFSSLKSAPEFLHILTHRYLLDTARAGVPDAPGEWGGVPDAPGAWALFNPPGSQ